MNEFPRKRTKLERQYDLGWKAYEKGVPFSPYTDPDWQRGFRDARDAGAISGRNRVLIGDASDAERRTDSAGRQRS
jgi:hypothetical protein